MRSEGANSTHDLYLTALSLDVVEIEIRRLRCVQSEWVHQNKVWGRLQVTGDIRSETTLRILTERLTKFKLHDCKLLQLAVERVILLSTLV